MTFSIMVHDPKDTAAQQELAKKVAAVHAQTVMEKVKSMSCPTEQKARLIDAVILEFNKKLGKLFIAP